MLVSGTMLRSVALRAVAPSALPPNGFSSASWVPWGTPTCLSTSTAFMLMAGGRAK